MAIEKRRLLLDIWSRLPQPHFTPSSEPIDVVIPVIAKDLGILPLCLEGVRACVANTVKDIYLVAPPVPEIAAFAALYGCRLVDEATVLDGLTPRELHLVVHTAEGMEVNRSGWLFQQLLKLSGRIGTCRHYLTVDADHVLLQSHTFLASDGCPVLYLSEERNPAYRQNIRQLMCNHAMRLNPWSYVAHKMLFSKDVLQQLQSEIERQHPGMTWIEAILQSYDRNEVSGFSEFELYGNCLKHKHLLPWMQKELHYSALASYQELKSRYAQRYRSVTFPEWINTPQS